MTLAKTAAVMLTVMLCVGTPGALALDKHAPAGNALSEKLGDVNFPVSCNPAAQKEFNRAMALFHSFWFDPAIKSFQTVIQHDPQCGMAYWGIALMSLGNPFAWPPSAKAWEAGASNVTDAQRVAIQADRPRRTTLPS